MRVLVVLVLFVSGLVNAWCQSENKQDSRKKKDNEYLTYFEQSGYKQTPDYEQTIAFCKKLAEASEFVTYTSFGKSAQGRDLPLLIVDFDGYSEPREVKQTDRLVLLVQAGIHAGEIDGKDAGLMLLRDMVINGKNSNVLRGVTWLFIPIYNVDGHEYRFGPYNRINQNGPEKMGFRTTATNLNLNRDYLKADAVETRAWLKLFMDWLPDFFVDIHVTDGADYQYVLTYSMEIFANPNPMLSKWQKEKFIPYLEKSMKADKYPIINYVAFRNWHDPRSGLRVWGGNPMLSHSYVAFQNRPSLLIENHMLKDYKTRVDATYKCLVHIMEYLNRHSREIKELNVKSDLYVASEEFRKLPYPLQWKATSDSVLIDFLGYDYQVVKSELTGGDWFQYSKKPKTFQIPFFNHLEPSVRTTVPEAYIVPVEWNQVIELLELHGVVGKRLKKPVTLTVQTYQFDNVKFSSTPYEGRQQILSYSYEIVEKEKTYQPGSFIIDMSQGAAQLALHALEPDAPSSLLRWGFFNTIFEQKEYAESYVMEKLAREMLENSSELKQKYEKEVKGNPDYNSPFKILNWFYKHSPYWDDRINEYPVGKIMDRKILSSLPME